MQEKLGAIRILGSTGTPPASTTAAEKDSGFYCSVGGLSTVCFYHQWRTESQLLLTERGLEVRWDWALL